jgi:hypothetical protein
MELSIGRQSMPLMQLLMQGTSPRLHFLALDGRCFFVLASTTQSEANKNSRVWWSTIRSVSCCDRGMQVRFGGGGGACWLEVGCQYGHRLGASRRGLVLASSDISCCQPYCKWHSVGAAALGFALLLVHLSREPGARTEPTVDELCSPSRPERASALLLLLPAVSAGVGDVLKGGCFVYSRSYVF